ncbi:unnamed protein product [Meganyctiphanes norvegica]|uniref:Uncharacterized protein n=1 Tax=Meganyctiphanes norvegica TaxID=48144 RepID=A0AAV2RA32_MEGNR
MTNIFVQVENFEKKKYYELAPKWRYRYTSDLSETVKIFSGQKAAQNNNWKLKGALKKKIEENLKHVIIFRVVDFFNRINLIYGTVCEYCTKESCPTMSGGPKFEYLWADGKEYKKPTALPAPEYISLLMEWIESQINDEHVFPVTVDVPFPKTFHSLCKKILTRLFRVFVHVYIHHFDRVVAIGAEAHVNTCYKHFYYFILQFELVPQKELEPLRDMTAKICHEVPDSVFQNHNHQK